MVATLIAVAVLLATPSVQLARAKGKPGGGGGDPPPVTLPDWRYEVTWLEGDEGWEFRPEGMNDWGDVAGQAHGLDFAAAYLPSIFGAASAAVDLNDLGALWYEWNDLENPVNGWTAYNAKAINNHGDMAGFAVNVDGILRLFVLKDVFSASPRFLLLDSDSEIDLSAAPSINNDGVIVARATLGVAKYDPIDNYELDTILMVDGGKPIINDDQVILRGGATAKTSFVRFPGEDSMPLDGYSLLSMSNRYLCGERQGSKGKNGQPGGSVRIEILNVDGQLELATAEFLFKGSMFTRDINDFGEAIIYAGGAPGNFLFLDSYGALPLDDLVSADYPSWFDPNTTGIRTLEINNMRQICGWQVVNSDAGPYVRGYILTPGAP